MIDIPALIGDYPTSFFVFEIIIWGIVLGIPGGLWWLMRRRDGAGSSMTKALIVGVSVAAWLCVVQGSFHEPRRLVVREVQVTVPTLPSLRLAILADIHVGPYKGKQWVQKVVDQVNQLENIDAVLIPGDFVFGGAGKYVSELAPLADLKHTKIFATLGNHDHDIVEPRNTLQSEAVSKALQKLELRELKNKSYWWEEPGFWLLGIDDNYLEYHDLESTFADVDEAPKILLAHSPDIVDDLGAEYNADLVISGHTHCGQIRLPRLGAVPGTIPTRNGKTYERHVYQLPHTTLVITCGVGEVGPRSRFFNPPEIVMLRVN